MISSGDDTTDLVSYDSDVNKIHIDVYEFHRLGAIISHGDIMNGVWPDAITVKQDQSKYSIFYGPCCSSDKAVPHCIGYV